MLKYLVGLFSMTALSACGGPSGDGGVDTDGSPNSCTGSETRCSGAVYQVCQNGVFTDETVCPEVCDPGLGCVACSPTTGDTCQGTQVHSCNPDGTVGPAIEECAPSACINGSCVAPVCGAGADLVYVVDQNYRLLSFDPRKLDLGQDPFTLIGPISCPTVASSYNGWGNPPTPFSMSVDRDATAWVLFTNGEIFHVSTEDASCQATGFTRGQQGFELFGMGFVSDVAGSQQETLWIVGGTASGGSLDIGDLGSIDEGTLQVSGVGPLPGGATYSPELTGTGAAELFAYYPGDYVALLDKETAQHQQTWDLPPLGDVRAWAFAHWGGNFYIFVTTVDGFGNLDSQVQFLNRQTGEFSTLLTDQPYVIVGAGVSTCAPVIIE